MVLCVGWKIPVESGITLNPEGAEDSRDIEANTDDNYRVKLVHSAHFFVARAESRPNCHIKTLTFRTLL